MIENPQPAWLPIILFTFPGLGFAAFALNQALFPREDRPLCTVPAIGIVLAILPTHVIALATGSLTIGVAVGWSLAGSAGYVWVVRHWREFSSGLSLQLAGARFKAGITAAAMLPIIPPTLLANFSDEANFNGHHAIIAHLQNGIYPPRYLYEPSLLLKYHYGFDLAAAIFTGLLRVELDHAIDLLTLTLWPCMFLLLWRVGEHVGGRRAGLAAALVVCFAGGWPLLAWGGSCGICTVNGLRVNPPFIHYFFQHPWSLAVPLFCLVILQRAALSRLHNQLFGLAALVFSLALLSLAHVVLFLTTATALFLTEAWAIMRSRDRHAMTVVAAVTMSLLVAKLIGGFLVSGAFPPAGGVFGTGFDLHDFSGPDRNF